MKKRINMEASNLRIGNCINTILNTTEGEIETIGIVKALHINTCEVSNNNTFSYNMVEPIPITKEWLIRLGFEEDGEYFYKIELKQYYSVGWYLSTKNELTKSISEFMIRLKYVHEVQNLYFSLCGVELVVRDFN